DTTAQPSPSSKAEYPPSAPTPTGSEPEPHQSNATARHTASSTTSGTSKPNTTKPSTSTNDPPTQPSTSTRREDCDHSTNPHDNAATRQVRTPRPQPHRLPRPTSLARHRLGPQR